MAVHTGNLHGSGAVTIHCRERADHGKPQNAFRLGHLYITIRKNLLVWQLRFVLKAILRVLLKIPFYYVTGDHTAGYDREKLVWLQVDRFYNALHWDKRAVECCLFVSIEDRFAKPRQRSALITDSEKANHTEQTIQRVLSNSGKLVQSSLRTD